MKKRLLLVFGLLFLAGAVFASSTPESGTGTAGADPYVVDIYYPGSPQNDEKLVEDTLNEYLVDKINTKIDIHPTGWGDYIDKTTAMLASREKFDLVFTASWSLKFYSNVAKGAYYDITELLPRHAPDYYKMYPPNILDSVTVGGRIYAIPTVNVWAHDFGIVIRENLLNDLGHTVEELKSFEDFEPILEKAKKAYPDMITYGTEGWGPYNSLDWDYAGDDYVPGVLNPPYIDDDTTFFPQFESPRTVERLKMYRRWFEKGYLFENIDTVTREEVQAMDKEGMIFSVHLLGKPGIDVARRVATGFDDWKQVSFTPAVTYNRDVVNAMFAIPAASEDPASTLKFVNLFVTDPYVANTFEFGIEGTHYNVIDRDKGLISQIAGSGFSNGPDWMFFSCEPIFVQREARVDIPEQNREFRSHAKTGKSMGFAFDPTPVKTELAAYMNALAAYKDPLIDWAQYDNVEETLKMLIEDLKAAGRDRIIAEKQRQFDAWMASKK